MVSNDFKTIMQNIHTEGYSVSCTQMHGEQDDTGNFKMQASITLEKNGDNITIETSEFDCIKYVAQLRTIAETDGEILLAPINNPNQYNQDIMVFIDEDKKKLQNAWEEVMSKKFIFGYHPIKLIDELLESRANIRRLDKSKFIPLLKDYFHILALILSYSQNLLKLHKRVGDKFSIQELLQAMEWIYTGFSLRTKNPIKNYRYFKSCSSFDTDMLFEQLSYQGQKAEEIIKSLINGQTINLKRDIPKLMNIYSGCIESLIPLINLLRIALELRRGIILPEKDYPLRKNVTILKSDAQYGSLFKCLDEQIRHGDAHTSTFIRGDLVEIRNGLTRKSKVIRTFKGIELANIILEMRQQFFPALMTATAINDYGLLDLLLISPEYKVLLATVGNGRK